jgi:hypothetical protein
MLYNILAITAQDDSKLVLIGNTTIVDVLQMNCAVLSLARKQ